MAKQFQIFQTKLGYRLVCTTKMNKWFHHGQLTPAFYAACGVSEATVTVAGMMPILQANADENNTVVTILNKFQEMMHHLDQKHVVIVGDQPLYSRTK